MINQEFYIQKKNHSKNDFICAIYEIVFLESVILHEQLE